MQRETRAPHVSIKTQRLARANAAEWKRRADAARACGDHVQASWIEATQLHRAPIGYRDGHLCAYPQLYA